MFKNVVNLLIEKFYFAREKKTLFIFLKVGFQVK